MSDVVQTIIFYLLSGYYLGWGWGMCVLAGIFEVVTLVIIAVTVKFSYWDRRSSNENFMRLKCPEDFSNSMGILALGRKRELFIHPHTESFTAGFSGFYQKWSN